LNKKERYGIRGSESVRKTGCFHARDKRKGQERGIINEEKNEPNIKYSFICNDSVFRVFI
jgi:hypothetical protein